jgi:hypothetical protein
MVIPVKSQICCIIHHIDIVKVGIVLEFLLTPTPHNLSRVFMVLCISCSSMNNVVLRNIINPTVMNKSHGACSKHDVILKCVPACRYISVEEVSPAMIRLTIVYEDVVHVDVGVTFCLLGCETCSITAYC